MVLGVRLPNYPLMTVASWLDRRVVTTVTWVQPPPGTLACGRSSSLWLLVSLLGSICARSSIGRTPAFQIGCSGFDSCPLRFVWRSKETAEIVIVNMRRSELFYVPPYLILHNLKTFRL